MWQCPKFRTHLFWWLPLLWFGRLLIVRLFNALKWSGVWNNSIIICLWFVTFKGTLNSINIVIWRKQRTKITKLFFFKASFNNSCSAFCFVNRCLCSFYPSNLTNCCNLVQPMFVCFLIIVQSLLCINISYEMKRTYKIMLYPYQKTKLRKFASN